MTPTEDFIFEVLADKRYNVAEICRMADVNLYKVRNRLQKKSLRKFPEEELERLWEAMQILQ